MMPNSLKSSLKDDKDPDRILALRTLLSQSQSEFALTLSRAAQKSPPYSKGYVSNLETGKQPITEEISRALRNVVRLYRGDMFGPFIETSIQTHPGNVANGSIFSGSSRLCVWEDCGTSFIPTSATQKQCPKCKDQKRRKR